MCKCWVARRRVASYRGVEIFSSLLAFDNYVPSQNYGGWFMRKRGEERGKARERERERERERKRERVVRRFSARWAPLCSEVKRTVQARLSSSSIPRLHFAAVYSSPVEDSAVLQSSFPDSHRGFLFPPFALSYLPSSRGFILQCRTWAHYQASPFQLILFAVSLFLLIRYLYWLLFALTFTSWPLIFTVIHSSIVYAFAFMQLLSFFHSSHLFQFYSSSSVLILSFSPSASLLRHDLWKWAIWGKLHGYLPPETYNGRFTALVNKYFLLNNIREKRDGAMLTVHYTPRNSSELDAKPREERDVVWPSCWKDCIFTGS